MYFALRDECPFDLNEYDARSANSTNKFCPSTADYLLCFPSTPANQTLNFKCPYKRGLRLRDHQGLVTRRCNATGSWESTEYMPCIQNVAVNCKPKNGSGGIGGEVECQDSAGEQHIFKILALFNFIGFCVTVMFVSFAIFIFLSIRSLRCTRNMIHCNMLFTFMFKSTAHIGFYIFIASKKDINYKTNDVSH
jgi:hypothetical protein